MEYTTSAANSSATGNMIKELVPKRTEMKQIAGRLLGFTTQIKAKKEIPL